MLRKIKIYRPLGLFKLTFACVWNFYNLPICLGNGNSLIAYALFRARSIKDIYLLFYRFYPIMEQSNYRRERNYRKVDHTEYSSWETEVYIVIYIVRKMRRGKKSRGRPSSNASDIFDWYTSVFFSLSLTFSRPVSPLVHGSLTHSSIRHIYTFGPFTPH